MRPVTSLASTALHENSNNEDNIDGMVRKDDYGYILLIIIMLIITTV